jgi:hypothetical protein
MHSKDTVLLEEAYLSIVKEDAQDVNEDSVLRTKLLNLIIGAGKRGELSEGLAERNAPMLVDVIMKLVQDHCAVAYDNGIEDARAMQQDYPE